MLKKPNSEQLQVAIDKNPTYPTRELSSHMTMYRKMKRLGWKSPKGWEMSPPPHTICQKSTNNSV
ncbi:unnamed protein product [Hymenolepis diminuta]|uniref:Uncharacterized protein n=1 Tax=Hymenolepis diminuta TaxID=6216 RepID=A0A564ZD23_HYMDI|nr:unnamed protein product [Hymenolepis diminuta]